MDGNPGVQHAHGQVELTRLKLRKLDGEVSNLFVDALTQIAKLQAKTRDLLAALAAWRCPAVASRHAE